MSKYSALVKRASNATAALALTLASLTPAVMLGGSAKAAQISGRAIDLESSAPGVTSTWTVSFTSTASADMDLEVCTSPLFDVVCTEPTGVDIDAGTVGDQRTYSYNGSAVQTFNFEAKNPTDVDLVNGGNQVGTFYVRMTDNTNSLTGSVAISTTNDLTINARVQEQLSFCVGSVDDANLTGASGNDSDFGSCADGEFAAPGLVDLGVVGSTETSTSPVTITTYSGNEDTGVFMIQTNAILGAVVSYTSTGPLQITGETCDGSLTDPCFNSASNYTAWTAEKFGMTLEAPHKGSLRTDDGTSNLTRNVDYYNVNKIYNWNESSTTADPIANTNGTVADWEYAVMTFKARAAATTPTGSYTTTANYVATATF